MEKIFLVSMLGKKNLFFLIVFYLQHKAIVNIKTFNIGDRPAISSDILLNICCLIYVKIIHEKQTYFFNCG